jgi:hypothetical protein
MTQQPAPTVSPDSLTTETLSFDRQAGLSAVVPQLSLENWDVDPNLVKERLSATPVKVTRE